MCGIVGFTGEDPSGAYLSAMNDLQRHRGPDDSGSYRSGDGSVNLAMRRLSIVDINGGHQPMTTSDGRYTVVFNGEIFNAKELRQQLESIGARFKSHHSDTEVVLEGYAVWGSQILSRLNGMFAFVIYDDLSRKLFCARDQVGIKPFYYSVSGRRLSFASEIKSLKRLPWIGTDLNEEAVFHYFSLQHCPSPLTHITDIRQLGPGCYLEFDLQTIGLRESQYWTAQFSSIKTPSEKDLPVWVREYLEDAVKRWSISDIPLACSLSGGLDSSAIVACLSARTSERLKTYTLGFSDSAELDERSLALNLSQRYGTEHHEIVISANDLLSELDAMLYALDEPYAGGLPSWYVYKAIGRDIRVTMTGVGGDELFGNYRKWRVYENPVRYLRTASSRLREGGRPIDLLRYPRGFVYRPFKFTDGRKQSCLLDQSFLAQRLSTSKWIEERFDKALSFRDAIAGLDLQGQLSDEFLFMTDRFSMAHSVEARTPFLDQKFIAAILSIPSHQRTTPRDPKGLLKKAVADLLPAEILSAPKKGFVLPIDHWLKTELRDQLMEFSDPAYIQKQSIFKKDIRKFLVDPFLSGHRGFAECVWTWWIFQRWWRLNNA